MAIPKAVEERLDRSPGHTRIAIVGATRARHKYGNIILRDLLSKGFEVVPIHPTEADVEGLAAYPSVADAPGTIHIVNFVVPPDVSQQVTEALEPERVPVVWYQPGSFDAHVVEGAKARFQHVIAGPCIMVETR